MPFADGTSDATTDVAVTTTSAAAAAAVVDAGIDDESTMVG